MFVISVMFLTTTSLAAQVGSSFLNRRGIVSNRLELNAGHCLGGLDPLGITSLEGTVLFGEVIGLHGQLTTVFGNQPDAPYGYRGARMVFAFAQWVDFPDAGPGGLLFEFRLGVSAQSGLVEEAAAFYGGGHFRTFLPKKRGSVALGWTSTTRLNAEAEWLVGPARNFGLFLRADQIFAQDFGLGVGIRMHWWRARNWNSPQMRPRA